jgi:hypothetical protein
MRLTWLLLAPALISLVGCASYATLQDPETMPAKKLQLGFGATFNAYPLEIRSTTTSTDPMTGAETSSTSVEHDRITVPALTFSARYGVSDRFEVHGMAWFPLGATVGGKYMLVGDRKEGGFAFSPGLDVSAPVSVSIGDESAVFFDVYVPLHMGYRTSPSFALYWTPKYVLGVTSGEIGHSFGGTLGVAVGESTQLLLEGGALYNTSYEETIVEGAIGVAFM